MLSKIQGLCIKARRRKPQKDWRKPKLRFSRLYLPYNLDSETLLGKFSVRGEVCSKYFYPEKITEIRRGSPFLIYNGPHLLVGQGS